MQSGKAFNFRRGRNNFQIKACWMRSWPLKHRTSRAVCEVAYINKLWHPSRELVKDIVKLLQIRNTQYLRWPPDYRFQYFTHQDHSK